MLFAVVALGMSFEMLAARANTISTVIVCGREQTGGWGPPQKGEVFDSRGRILTYEVSVEDELPFFRRGDEVSIHPDPIVREMDTWLNDVFDADQ